MFAASQFKIILTKVAKIIKIIKQAIHTSLEKVMKNIFLMYDVEGFFTMNLIAKGFPILIRSTASKRSSVKKADTPVLKKIYL